MSFIIFNYVRQDRILGVADHKFLKSFDTVHTNAAPLRCSPLDCSKEANTAREEVEPRFSYALERVFHESSKYMDMSLNLIPLLSQLCRH